MESDEEKAIAALKKIGAKEKPTRDEAQALARIQKKQKEELWTTGLKAIPLRVFCALAGRKPNQVRQQAQRYGMPISGDTVDLYQFLAWVYDDIAKNARSPGGDESSEESQLNKNREIDYQRKLLKLQQESEQLIPRVVVHEGFSKLASHLKRFFEALQRECGVEYYDQGMEVLDDCRREIYGIVGQAGSAKDDSNGP